MEINMLCPGKVRGCDATFEIDSGAQFSLEVSKDLISESDMLPGTDMLTSLSKVSWDILRLYHVLVLMLLSMVCPSVIN